MDAWFGNSEGVRRKHYYQVTDQNYQRALSLFEVDDVCGSACGSIGANRESSTEVTDEEKTNQTAVSPCFVHSKIPPSRVELLFPD